MKDRIICLVGPSGSGKTTVAVELEKQGYSIIHSYTDREPRSKDEWGHTFISKEDKIDMDEVIAYVEIYGGYRYFATRSQYKDKGVSIYVVCPGGVKQVLKNVKDAEVEVIYLSADEYTRIGRLKKREGVSEWRGTDDWELDAMDRICERIKKDKELFKTCKCDYVIDTNRRIEEVVDLVKQVIGLGGMKV